MQANTWARCRVAQLPAPWPAASPPTPACKHQPAACRPAHHTRQQRGSAAAQASTTATAACAGSRAETRDFTKAPSCMPGFRQHDGFPHNDYYSDGSCRSSLRLGSRCYLLQKGTLGGVLAGVLLPPPSHAAARRVTQAGFSTYSVICPAVLADLSGAHSSLLVLMLSTSMFSRVGQRQHPRAAFP